MASCTTAPILLLPFFLLSGILNLQTVTYSSGCLDIEKKALLKFKDGLRDDTEQLSSWSGNDCCKWAGISCDNRTAQVIRLTVHESGGEINPSLLELKHLNSLDLSMNNFEGTKIPSFIGSFQKLRYLNLSDSSFGGLIPPHLGNLSSLLLLDLKSYANEPIENDIKWISGLSSLRYLNLAGLNLSGAADSWHPTVNMLPSLTELHLPHCSLSNLPFSLPSVNFTNLSVLDLSNNVFSSRISDRLSNLTALVDLNLQSNNFRGALPGEISTLSSLKTLDLSGNYMGDRLSKELGNLCSLEVLKLSSNKFSGNISNLINGFRNCTNVSLETLELQYNDFTGELPISIRKLNNLRYLDLRRNSFQGSIPKSMGEMSSLEELYLSNNKMNGDIPETIGKLSKLSVLELSENQWEGIITEVHLMNLSSLQQLQISKASQNISLLFNISTDWIPPFQLKYLCLRSCQLGPKFPLWLKNQNELNTIVLNNARICDTIPQWFLELNLQVNEFDVGCNQLSGKVPNSFNFQSHAMIDLSSNLFNGPIPLWSPNVSQIYLGSNLFSGPIPQNIGEVMPYLTNLDLSDNSLNGSIPSSIGNLNTLRTLVISHNHLSGEVPDFWDQMPYLYILDISNNSLSGTVPRSIASLESLRFFVLSNNNLHGKPPSLKKCSSIESVDLGYNRFSGNLANLIGGSMQSLLILRVRNNSFSDRIPSTICTLSNLHILDLSQNNFSGFIPSCMGNLSGFKIDLSSKDVGRFQWKLRVIAKGTVLEYFNTLYLVNSLDLSGNNLSGEIPNELMSLYRLWTLNLSSNYLTGNIPWRINSLALLETLDLSNNEFYGSIPSSMASLTCLAHLNLSYNNLSGKIPSNNQFKTFNDPSIYEGNIELCGPPLKKVCTSQSPNANANRDEEDEDGNNFEREPFFISMAMGFIVGFWIILGTFVIKKFSR